MEPCRTQVVGDHYEFRGRGAESSGDPFPAAPNIDHSAPFVKEDLSQWLRWLRAEFRFDGWRCALRLPVSQPHKET